MSWIRLDSNILTDEWLNGLEQDERYAWLAFISYLGSCRPKWILKITSVSIMCRILNLTEKSFVDMLTSAISNGKIIVNNFGEWEVANGRKYDYDTTARERVRLYRDKKQERYSNTRNSRYVTGVTPTYTYTDTNTEDISLSNESERESHANSADSSNSENANNPNCDNVTEGLCTSLDSTKGISRHGKRSKNATERKARPIPAISESCLKAVETYNNEKAKSWPRVLNICKPTPQRFSESEMLTGFDVSEILRRARASDFLSSRKVFNFLWFLSRSEKTGNLNWQDVLDGRYDNVILRGNAKEPSQDWIDQQNERNAREIIL